MDIYTENNMYIYHKTESDFNNKTVSDPIWLSKGDTKISIIAVSLYNNGVLLNDAILSNSTAKLRCLINGSNYTKDALGYNNGTVYFASDPTLSGHSGLFEAQVELTVTYPGVGSGIVSIYPFRLNIVGNLISDNILPTSILDILNGTAEHIYIDTIDTIRNGFFRNFTSLEDVKIKYCKHIDNSAFDGCSNLKEADLGYTLLDLGGFVFARCPLLRTIIIRNTNNVVDITNGPFTVYEDVSVYVPQSMIEAYRENEEWNYILNPSNQYKVRLLALNEGV